MWRDNLGLQLLHGKLRHAWKSLRDSHNRRPTAARNNLDL
jgi:hypothetical protein